MHPEGFTALSSVGRPSPEGGHPGDGARARRLKGRRRDLLQAVWRSPPRADASAPAGVRTIELGLVVTPVLDAPTAERLGEDLERELARRYPDVRWKVTAVRDALVTAPAALPEVFDAARAQLLDRDWDLVVHVTELPLRVARRPVVMHSSRTHGAAVVSLPALGLKQTSGHLVSTIADAVGVFVGDDAQPRERNRMDHSGRVRRRLVELAGEVEDSDALECLADALSTSFVRLNPAGDRLLGVIGAALDLPPAAQPSQELFATDVKPRDEWTRIEAAQLCERLVESVRLRRGTRIAVEHKSLSGAQGLQTLCTSRRSARRAPAPRPP